MASQEPGTALCGNRVMDMTGGWIAVERGSRSLDWLWKGDSTLVLSGIAHGGDDILINGQTHLGGPSWRTPPFYTFHYDTGSSAWSPAVAGIDSATLFPRTTASFQRDISNYSHERDSVAHVYWAASPNFDTIEIMKSGGGGTWVRASAFAGSPGNLRPVPLSYSPTGDFLTFTYEHQRDQLWVADLTASPPTVRLLESFPGGYVYRASISEDGNVVGIYYSWGGGCALKYVAIMTDAVVGPDWTLPNCADPNGVLTSPELAGLPFRGASTSRSALGPLALLAPPSAPPPGSASSMERRTGPPPPPTIGTRKKRRHGYAN